MDLFRSSLSFSFDSLLVSLVTGEMVISRFDFVQFVSDSDYFFRLSYGEGRFSAFP